MKGRPSCSACGGREYAREAEACPRCGDVGAQIEDWLRLHCPPSVSGNGGHAAAFKAACAVVGGFGLGEAEAMGVMRVWNMGCSPEVWSERELLHKVREAGKAGGEAGKLVWRAWSGGNGAGSGAGATGARPVARMEDEAPRQVLRGNREDFSMETLDLMQSPGVRVDREWLQARSVCRLDSVTPELFLCGLYEPGSRVLVFTKFASQGQFLFEVPGAPGRRGGAWRLGRTRGEKAERVESLPREGSCGVWFLNQPVDGVWREKPGSTRHGNAGPEWSRRSANGVTDWRYMVLESDIEGIEEKWVNFLAGLRMPVVAMYTSGSKSVHALVRLDAASQHHFDVLRDKVKPMLTKCGADPGVFSAVRLTRLPGCLRHGTEKRGADGKPVYHRFPQPRKQELIYFNPRAEEGRGIL